MKLKITPLSTLHSHLEGEFQVGNNYYFAKFHSAGIITEVCVDDKWLEGETVWVSRSEIPFVTALRHVLLEDMSLIEGSATPIIRQSGTFYELKDVDRFPNKDECRQLVYKFCGYVSGDKYQFYKKRISQRDLRDIYYSFDIEGGLLIRAGACLYKSYLLLESSFTFSEEIYTNAFIAFEAMIEYLANNKGYTGKTKRERALDDVGVYLSTTEPGMCFRDHEEEMRDMIRNNIIHPFRHSGEINENPDLMADYVLEDLGLIDWIFKLVVTGQIS